MTGDDGLAVLLADISARVNQFDPDTALLVNDASNTMARVIERLDVILANKANS